MEQCEQFMSINLTIQMNWTNSLKIQLNEMDTKRNRKSRQPIFIKEINLIITCKT